VLTIPVSYRYGPYFIQGPMVESEEIIEVDTANAAEYLHQVAATSALNGVQTTIEVQIGSAASAICETVQTDAIDLVVISSRGQSGFKRWMLGSVTQKVARHSSVPVLVLREDETKHIAGQHPYNKSPLRVLVPLDGSATAMSALLPAAQLAAALASPGQGALHLIRVMKLDNQSGTEALDDPTKDLVLQKGRKYLTAVTEHLHEGIAGELKLAVTWSVVLDTDVAEALVNVAEVGEDAEGAGVFGGCDLIAMATHGRGGLQRWTMGSITERVLNTTRLPLLIVRPVLEANSQQADEDEVKLVNV
jgi:nucleotide-binding universal stress UspA family protein